MYQLPLVWMASYVGMSLECSYLYLGIPCKNMQFLFSCYIFICSDEGVPGGISKECFPVLGSVCCNGIAQSSHRPPTTRLCLTWSLRPPHSRDELVSEGFKNKLLCYWRLSYNDRVNDNSGFVWTNTALNSIINCFNCPTKPLFLVSGVRSTV